MLWGNDALWSRTIMQRTWVAWIVRSHGKRVYDAGVGIIYTSMTASDTNELIIPHPPWHPHPFSSPASGRFIVQQIGR